MIFFPKNRRALSAVIITLIMIALALVLVAVVWGIVSNLITKQTEDISLENFAVNLDIKKVYSTGVNDVAVEVKRNAGKAEITGLKFVFESDTDKEVVTQDASMQELETRTFTLTLQSLTPNSIIKISIAPVFKEDSKIGNIVVTYPLSSPMESGNVTSCTPTTCSALGYNCGTWANGTCSGTLDCGTCGSGYTCNSNGQCVSSCTPTTCLALGRECGTATNGTCAGTLSCGNCTLLYGAGYTCNSSGQCIFSCTPNCVGKQCGNDGCDGSCGTCSSGYTCNSSGQCVSSCTPDCTGKQCGNDGCDGSCGTCSSGYTCNSSGQCVSSASSWVSTQSDLEQDSYCYYQYCEYALFDISDLSGVSSSSISEAYIESYVTNVGTENTVVVWEVENTAWTETSTCADLNSYALNSTGKQVNANVCSSTGWCRINIANILKAALDSGHTKLSLRLHGEDSQTCGNNLGGATFWRIANDSCDDACYSADGQKQFYDRSDATYYPRLNVSY